MPIKTFILTQFSTPHPWSLQYLQHLGHLASTGWRWKIFTPNIYSNLPINVEVIPMTIEEFNILVEQKLGINPNNTIINGVPSKPMSDFYIASGKIFEDYLKGTDFWGITNWDIVYGNLSKFISDDLLYQSEVFSDDIATINGIFTLFRNTEKINTLFMEIPNWKELLTTHTLYGTDEYHMTEVMKQHPEILFAYPAFYPFHSHDRLEQHVPEVKLRMTEGGRLWELFADTNPPKWIHARPLMGREIAYFHFLRTKTWPLLDKQ